MKGTRKNPITDNTEIERLIDKGWMRSKDYMKANPSLKSTSHLYFMTEKGEGDKLYFEENGKILCLYREKERGEEGFAEPVSVLNQGPGISVASIDVQENLARVIDIGTRKGLLDEEEEFRLRKSLHDFMTR
ncbi:MAG: hypothetical protein LAT68_16295 [Cyclobacteriaceae bacterium]|nr:hypothetical protein [Cyclobacteriaceae bacterium]